MIERYTHAKAVWVHIKNPTAEEVQNIAREFSLAPKLVDDLTVVVPRSSVVCDNGVLKCVLKFPFIKRADSEHPYEVKFIIEKQTLITIQYEDIEAIDKFKKELDVVATLKKKTGKVTGAHLFISLMTELYSAAESKLDYIESLLATAEQDIFMGKEKEMVFELSRISKKLIAFRQAHRAHDHVFTEMEPLFAAVFTKTIAAKLATMHEHYEYVMRRAAGLIETLSDLRDTNTALLTTKQNEIMKILTILAFITFPLTLLSSMFGMNTLTTPIVGQEGDFWIIVTIMSVATVFFFGFFKYKRWM